MAKSAPPEKTRTKPDFNAFVVEEQEGKDPFWLKVGAAWAHKDGKGYNLELQAMPPSQDGKFRIVLREWKEPDAKSWPRAASSNSATSPVAIPINTAISR